MSDATISEASASDSVNQSVQAKLAEDIDLLGRMLGKIIVRLEGERAFALVEAVRAATAELRRQPSMEAAKSLGRQLEALDLDELRTLIRAFGVYFDLVNLAEQQARVRANRLRTMMLAPQPLDETPESALKALREKGFTSEQLRKLLSRAAIGCVFTAHPSEARRRTVLEKLAAIGRQLDRLEHVRLLPAEREEAAAAIEEELETMWLTSSIRASRPMVLDEVRQGLELVENGLLEIVPRLYRRLDAAVMRVYPELAPSSEGGGGYRAPAIVKFGSWIGGDRDGNPFVTHDVTVEAIRVQQETLLRQYQRLVNRLGTQLSHSDQFVETGEAFRASLEADAALLGKREHAAGSAKSSRSDEPYRGKCRAIAAKLRRTLEQAREFEATWSEEAAEPAAGVYLSGKQLQDDLETIAVDLAQAGASASAQGAVRDLVRLVQVFGVHLLTLDVRQHSGVHAAAIDEILSWCGVCPNYTKLSPSERLEVLAEELSQRRPLIPTHLPFSPPTNEVISTFRAIAVLLERQCPEAIENYIISGATEPAHLLEVLLLAREARLFQPEQGISRLHIIPLFEALEPLNTAATIVNRLLNLPVYRRHLELRGNVQEVMIGYSDSNKESGFLQSAWALYRAQRAMAETERRMGVVVQIFHGRGGAIGRGGGPANRAILAQPPGSVGGRLRITEQGEVIADRYGHKAIAERHLGQLISAVLASSATQTGAASGYNTGAEKIDPQWERLVARLADRACRHYRQLVYETPEFLSYFEQATPINEIANLKIASRPTRRNTISGIDHLRAIPWVFSWMQSRHTLPGWYGLGSAIRDHLDENPEDAPLLADMYRQWPFWTTLIDNAQMILAKADLLIARLYADLVEDAAIRERIFSRIEAEHRTTAEVICQMTGQDEILAHTPVLYHSIRRRNPDIDPMSFIQIELLCRLRRGDEPQGELMTAVLESINGIAAGLKNTG